MKTIIHLPHDHGNNTSAFLQTMPEQATFARTADTFDLLSDPTRVKILWLLCHTEDCVANIAAAVEMSSPAGDESDSTIKDSDPLIKGSALWAEMALFRMQKMASPWAYSPSLPSVCPSAAKAAKGAPMRHRTIAKTAIHRCFFIVFLLSCFMQTLSEGIRIYRHTPDSRLMMNDSG